MATIAAWLAAVIVLAAGTWTVLVPRVRDLDQGADAYAPRRELRATRTVSADGTTTETTIADGDDDLVSRTLGEGGLLVVRGAVVVAAAFLVGGLAQRALLGRFTLRPGPAELGAQLRAQAEVAGTALRAAAAAQRRVEELELHVPVVDLDRDRR